MPMIKVTGYLEVPEELADDCDSCGLTEVGYMTTHRELAKAGLQDIELEPAPEGSKESVGTRRPKPRRGKDVFPADPKAPVTPIFEDYDRGEFG